MLAGSAVVGQKSALVGELRQAKYADVLAAHPSIRLLLGEARLRPDGAVEVDGRHVPARKVLLATGASPAVPTIPGLSDTPFLTSTSVMELDRLPEHLIVLGGGYVGLELGQAFRRFGARVTVLARSGLLRGEEPEIVAQLAGHLRDEGLAVHAGLEVERVQGETGRIQVVVREGGTTHTVEGDRLLVATGRRPNSGGMGLEEAGVTLGDRGQVVVDEHLRTSHPDIYAAGDVIGDPAFVYVAAYAGRLAADNALGEGPRAYDVSVVPRVTFTDPAVAAVGMTEAEARGRGQEVVTSLLPMAHVPRAIAARDTRGLVKLVADGRTNLLLGAHILAPEAGDIIQEAVLAIRFGLRVRDLASVFHPYLTNAEAFKLACQGFEKDVATLSCCAA